MLKYSQKLKNFSRKLRNDSTDAEILIWSHLRYKQLSNVQFYRQKPIGNYIVDFYAPALALVIEVDGGQHLEEDNLCKDNIRDLYLKLQGLRVLRFDNLQVIESIDEVVEVIVSVVDNILMDSV